MSKRKRKNEDDSNKDGSNKDGSNKDGSKSIVKYKGVTKIGERYRAQIRIDGKVQNCGTFDTRIEVAQAYDRAAIQAGHPVHKLNFPDSAPVGYKPKVKKLSSANTIGYRGVYKNGKNRFKAQIRVDHIDIGLGNFGTIKEAAIAYDLAAVEANRPKTELNFPDMIHSKETKEKIRATLSKRIENKKKNLSAAKKRKITMRNKTSSSSITSCSSAANVVLEVPTAASPSQPTSYELFALLIEKLQ
jgi:hypothetical protein